jgi:hypothetical protein
MVLPTASCRLSGDTAKQAALKPGMKTDWVLVMVSRLYKASVDVFSLLEPVLVARKDPQLDSTGGVHPPTPDASPMVALAKSEEPSALQSRMIDPVPATAMQALSVPPEKNRERIMPPPGL